MQHEFSDAVNKNCDILWNERNERYDLFFPSQEQLHIFAAVEPEEVIVLELVANNDPSPLYTVEEHNETVENIRASMERMECDLLSDQDKEDWPCVVEPPTWIAEGDFPGCGPAMQFRSLVSFQECCSYGVSINSILVPKEAALLVHVNSEYTEYEDEWDELVEGDRGISKLTWQWFLLGKEFDVIFKDECPSKTIYEIVNFTYGIWMLPVVDSLTTIAQELQKPESILVQYLESKPDELWDWFEALKQEVDEIDEEDLEDILKTKELEAYKVIEAYLA